MCGIFGLIVGADVRCDAKAFQRALRRLFELSEPRGREAAGIAIATNDGISVYKQPVAPSQMLGSARFRRFLGQTLAGQFGVANRPVAAMDIAGW